EEVKLRDGSGIGSSPNSSGTTSGTAARGNTSPIPSAPKTSSRSWGARLSSFVAGSIVGVPICLVRRTYFETKTGALDLAGPHSNPVLLGATAAFSLPYAVCGGFLEAVP